MTLLLLSSPPFADNCGSMSDCYNTAAAALAALVGLSVLFGVMLSVALDFVPVVGTVKGIIEAITGRDLVTGQELAWWERLLGIVPVIGGAAGVAAAISKGSRAIDDIADVGRGIDRASDAADAASDAARAAENARDAERAAEAAAAHKRALGMDPATGRYRAGEADTAVRVEEQTGTTLSRSTDPSVDWVDEVTGKTYDAVGNFPPQHFDSQWPNLQTKIIDHLAKADYVPVDVSQWSPDQIAKVQKFITDNGLGPRAFLVGN